MAKIKLDVRTAAKNMSNKKWTDGARKGEFFIRTDNGWKRMNDGEIFPAELEKILVPYDLEWAKNKNLIIKMYCGEGREGGSIKVLKKTFSPFKLYAYEINSYDPWIWIVSNAELTPEQVRFIDAYGGVPE